MRILFIDSFTVELVVNGGKQTGGASVQTLVWIKTMRELGSAVSLAKFEDDFREKKEEFSWISLIPVYHSQKLKGAMVWFTYRFPKLFLAIRKTNCQYLYTSMPTWQTFYIGLICKILKVKHIIRTANDKNIDFSLDKKIRFLDRKFISFSYNISDLILAQSDYQYQLLKKKYPKKNILKISNPIVIKERYLKVKEKMEGYIAWIGNFRFQKNFKLLHEIASNYREQQFKIAGNALINMDLETSTFYEKLKLLENVEFVGSISQEKILDFLSGAKYLLSTSRFEGFSNTFLEAMMTGLPIISPAHINPDGIIDNFNVGILYQEVCDLTNSLQKVEKSNYIQMSQNCISYLKEHHHHLNLGKLLMNNLKSLN